MINLSNITAGLVLGLAVTSAALPASAASRGIHPGANARAQAVEGITSDGAIPQARARALRECNAKVSGLVDYNWGVTIGEEYRKCMAERGQLE